MLIIISPHLNFELLNFLLSLGFQKNSVCSQTLSDLVEFRLPGFPAITPERDITLVAAVGLPTRHGEVRIVQTR